MADSDLENKCENLMNIVVETRKHYGKLCAEYGKKTSTVENLLMNLQIKTLSHYHFKKQPIYPSQQEDVKDYEAFTDQLQQRHKRIEELKKKVKSTQAVVFQLKADSKGERHKKCMRDPLTADVLLARAKAKEAVVTERNV